jgi:hypothetical protein
VYADPARGMSPANSAYENAAAALATPATRNDRSTAGPAVSLATCPASEKMPAPMIPPTPIAVSWRSVSVLLRPVPPASGPVSISSTGLRRNRAAIPPRGDVVVIGPW